MTQNKITTFIATFLIIAQIHYTYAAEGSHLRPGALRERKTERELFEEGRRERIRQILLKYPEARLSTSHLYYYILEINESDTRNPILLPFEHWDYLRAILKDYHGKTQPSHESPLVELDKQVQDLDRDTATMVDLGLLPAYKLFLCI